MPERGRFGRYVGVLGGAAGLTAALFVLIGPVVRVESESTAGGVETGTVSGIDYLLGHPDAQVALFAWPLILGALSVVGALAAWRGNAAWTASVAATLAVFVVLGLMSIGLLFAPAAVLLGAAAVVTWTRN